MFFKVLLALVFTFGCLASQAQQIIQLKNASLEGYPMYSTEVEGWENCNTIDETPVDLHSEFTYHFDINVAPAHGLSYLGMVTRDNMTNEQISQKLAIPLDSTNTYAITLKLCRSANYNSTSRSNGRYASFTKPIQLRIYGSHSLCEKGEVLAESELIDHREWKGYSFTFTPKQNWEFLTLAAYDSDAESLARNGHILLDDISNIIPINKPITPSPSIDNVFKSAKNVEALETLIAQVSEELVVDGLLQVSAMVKLQTEALLFGSYTVEIAVNNQVKSLRQLMTRQSEYLFREHNKFEIRKIKPKDSASSWLFENDLYKVRLIKR